MALTVHLLGHPSLERTSGAVYEYRSRKSWALLAYLLLRYLSFLSQWSHSFTRLFTVIRACLWKKWDLLELLRRYGTAGGHFRHLATPQQAYFPGFA